MSRADRAKIGIPLRIVQTSGGVQYRKNCRQPVTGRPGPWTRGPQFPVEPESPDPGPFLLQYGQPASSRQFRPSRAKAGELLSSWGDEKLHLECRQSRRRKHPAAPATPLLEGLE